MKKNIVLTLVFVFCLLCVFILIIITPTKDYSRSERRHLTQFPTINSNIFENKDFEQEFEKYSADQFPFREQFRGVKTFVSKYVFLKKDNNDLFTVNGHISKIDQQENDKMIDYASNLFKKVYDNYLKDANTNVYLSIVPDKNYFLTKNNGYPSLNYENFIDKVVKNNNFMTYIDITPYLSEEDYYYTDTHWKQENIIDISQQLVLNMQDNFISTDYVENVLDRPFDGVYKGQYALPFKQDTIKYLTSNTINNATVYYYNDMGKPVEGEIYNMNKAYGKDAYEMFLSGVAPLIKLINNSNSTDKKLILFRDSFGSSLAPLLLENYNEIIIVDLRYIQSSLLDKFIDFENSEVLFLYSTSILNNSMSMK